MPNEFEKALADIAKYDKEALEYDDLERRLKKIFGVPYFDYAYHDPDNLMRTCFTFEQAKSMAHAYRQPGNDPMRMFFFNPFSDYLNESRFSSPKSKELLGEVIGKYHLRMARVDLSDVDGAKSKMRDMMPALVDSFDALFASPSDPDGDYAVLLDSSGFGIRILDNETAFGLREDISMPEMKRAGFVFNTLFPYAARSLKGSRTNSTEGK